MVVHDGEDMRKEWHWDDPRWQRRELVTRLIFVLNIMKVGENECRYVANLVVVEIPEGVKSIGKYAFNSCRSLTTVSIPTTLTSIGEAAFADCDNLENVDFLHTKIQQLGNCALNNCKELKSMTIPSSSNWMESPNHGFLGHYVFYKCAKLVPSNINVDYGGGKEDTTKAILNYLSGRSTVSRNKSQPKTNNKNYA